MPKREIIEWFTTKTGLHIPIYNGQTKEEALQFVIDKAKDSKLVKPTNIKSGKIGKSVIDSLSKDKQIQKAKEEANRLNEEEQRKHLPKELSLPDIDADKANETSNGIYIRGTRPKDTPDSDKQVSGYRLRLKSGTKLTGCYAFAGYGTRKEYRLAPEFADRYKIGKPDEWQHCCGFGILEDGREVEIHWSQVIDGDVYEMSIKRFDAKNKRRRK